ncbi:YciI family protein [Mesorhizobium sanjuanii]|nr:YciI family protein [Mesorhizobium sanjuanii]
MPMLFAIHALDGDNGLQRRLASQDAHKAHLTTAATYGVTLIMSGPLVEDDGATMKGSLLIVDADGRAAVEAFNGADPYRKAGVWGSVTITAFQKRQG